MSESIISSSSNDEKTNKSQHKKPTFTKSLRTQVENMPDIINFIETILKFIGKQERKLKRLKSKLKKINDNKSVSTQTESESDISNNIVSDIKDAAEKAIHNSGFVYEETSGLYYDYSTGYYYNAEYGLYYDGNKGAYLKYNQETQSYEYHSQAANVDSIKHLKHNAKRKNKTMENRKGNKKRHSENISEENLEEGECSDSGSSKYESSLEDDLSDSSDITKNHPPCMRIIVENTSVPSLKIGSLHIITFEGGTIGREGDHSITIPDINTSKYHLNITYNKDTNLYQAVDMGSRNGTLLNGRRMSVSKQESEPLDIVHGSKLQIGSTVLLCHVHDGQQTCGHCEPGLLGQQEDDHLKPSNTSNKLQKHKTELKNLKKKFGVSNFDNDGTKIPKDYTDRAKLRRDTVGSQNPYEKTKTASVDTSIASDNKGFKMLSKMGWKSGEALGKEGGLVEPINVISNSGTTGLGSESIKVDPESVKENQKRNVVWKKTQDRFSKLSTCPDIFDDSD